MNPERISIRYTLELDELPGEVKRLYKKANSLLSNTSLIQYSDSQILSSSTLKHIHEIRLKLAKLDIILGDVHAIVNSYVEYEISQNSVDEAPPPTLDDSAPPPDPAALYSELSALTQQLQEGIPNEDSPQGT